MDRVRGAVPAIALAAHRQQPPRARFGDERFEPAGLCPGGVTAERRETDVPAPFSVRTRVGLREGPFALGRDGVFDQPLGGHCLEDSVEVPRQEPLTAGTLLEDLYQSPPVMFAVGQDQQDLEHDRFQGQQAARITKHEVESRLRMILESNRDQSGSVRKPRPGNHSPLRVTVGSTREARRAGT